MDRRKTSKLCNLGKLELREEFEDVGSYVFFFKGYFL